MAMYDYVDQLDEDVNIADPIDPENPIKYEYQLVDSIGKEPDQTKIYYTKNSAEEYVRCPITYTEVDTSKPPIYGEPYYKYTEKTGHVYVGQLDKFEVSSDPTNPIRYFVKADFVFDPRTKYYVKVMKPMNYTSISKFEDISSNHKYLEDFAEAIYIGSIGEILNRHVFKFTKLREDIIFIKLRLIKPGTSEKGSTFTIAVNERSFWNRLAFYKKEEPTSRYLPIDKIDPYDLLLASLRRSDGINRIVFKMIGDEVEQINSLIESTYEEPELKKRMESYNISNNANVEISGFEHYSKRLWIAYFEAIRNSSNNSVISQDNKVALGILDFKDQENIAFYNPNDPEYSRYFLFYQGQ